MQSRRLCLLLVLGSSLTLTACGLRVPHSQVLAQYSGTGAAGTVQQGGSVAADNGTASSGDNTASVPGDATPTADAGSGGNTGPADNGVPGTGGGVTAAPTSGSGSGPTVPGSSRTAAAQASGSTKTQPNGKASAAATAGAAAKSAAPGSGNTINIGVDASISGVTNIGASAKSTILAWAKYVNSIGGINGHPVATFVTDNHGDANTAVADMQQLVENDHVLAVIPGPAADESTYASYMQSKNVPVVGGFPLTPTPWQNPDFFPQGTEFTASQGVYLVEAAQLAKQTSLDVLYCAESSTCATDANDASNYAAKAGVTIKRKSEISIAQPDFTTNCLQAQGDGVKVLLVLGDGPTLSRVAQNCSAQGYNPTFIGDGDNSLPSQAALQGMLSESTSFSWTDTSTPAQQLFQKVMSQNGIKPDNIAADIWSGAEEIRKALDGATGTYTSQTIIDGLHTFKNELLGGLVPPPGMTFAKGANAVPNYCGIPMIIKNNAWVTAGSAVCANP